MTSIHIERLNGLITEFPEPHSNDHYACLLLDKGQLDIQVDYRKMVLTANTLFISYPGQVHDVIIASGSSGWFVAFDNKLVEDRVRNALEQSLSRTIILDLTVKELGWFKDIIKLMKTSGSLKCSLDVEYALLTAFASQAIETYELRSKDQAARHSSRNFNITKKFRQIVRHRYKSLKRPSDYADLLNFSVNYLNQTVKEVTGFTISFFIQQEITREAQRLLCHSDLSVKEIASSLGYDDHKYFNRLFHKVVGMPPGKFREKNNNPK